MQSVKPPVEAPISMQGRPVSEMDQWARACSSLRPPRLTYLRAEPRRRVAGAAGVGGAGVGWGGRWGGVEARAEGFVDALLVGEDAAGEDESLGAFAGGGVAVVDEELV